MTGSARAIQKLAEQSGLLRRFAPRNDDLSTKQRLAAEVGFKDRLLK
jgi:hypothetical protein